MMSVQMLQVVYRRYHRSNRRLGAQRDWIGLDALYRQQAMKD
jgi:hypothetical protein